MQVAEPESEGRKSGVFAGVGEAAKPTATPTIEAMPAVEQQPAAAAAVEAVAAPVAPAGGGPFAPVAPEDMANTNEGGKLHASEFDGAGRGGRS